MKKSTKANFISPKMRLLIALELIGSLRKSELDEVFGNTRQGRNYIYRKFVDSIEGKHE